MADITIPPPDAAGYWHFTYITTDTLDGRWYGGKHSTKKHPLSSPYKGSGNWIRRHPARKRLVREIVAFYPSSAAVFAAEAELITWAVVFDDPLCMNLRDGGEGVTAEAALLRFADPAERARHLATMRRMHADPKNHAKIVAALTRTRADPHWQAANLAHMRRMHADPVARENHLASLAARGPEWRANVVAALEGRRAGDPDWRGKVKATMLIKAADPEWYEARATENRRMATDPAWRAAYDQGMGKRAANLAAKRAAGIPAGRDSVFIVQDGKQVPLCEACRRAGVLYATALYRRKRGWPESRWLTLLR